MDGGSFPNEATRRVALDPDAISRDIVRALRGDRSQVAFARRLGYRSNAVYTWESGRRWPSASGFLRAAERVGIDVRAGVTAFLRSEPEWIARIPLATPEGVAALLTSLRGSTPIGEVAARAARSRFAVSRWLSGRSEPRLPELLRMVEATSLRGLEFVSVFADPAELPSTAGAWRRLVAARTMARSSPWAQAVVLALELAAYQALPAHDDAWLAARLGLPVDEVSAAVALLAQAGQITRDTRDTRNGALYAPVQVQALDVSSPDGVRELKRHWAEVALGRLAAGAPGTYSFNLVAVSERDLARIDELQRAHFRAIRALVAESAPAERLALVLLQLVPLG